MGACAGGEPGAAGVCVFLNAWELVAGDLIAVRLQKGLAGAGAVVFVVSAESVGRGWVNEEFAAAVTAAAAGRQRLIPVLAGEVALPPLVASRLHVDFRYVTARRRRWCCRTGSRLAALPSWSIRCRRLRVKQVHDTPIPLGQPRAQRPDGLPSPARHAAGRARPGRRGKRLMTTSMPIQSGTRTNVRDTRRTGLHSCLTGGVCPGVSNTLRKHRPTRRTRRHPNRTTIEHALPPPNLAVLKSGSKREMGRARLRFIGDLQSELPDPVFRSVRNGRDVR